MTPMSDQEALDYLAGAVPYVLDRESRNDCRAALSHIAARLGGGEVVAASEVFRIAGGDVEVNTNPTAADALECLRDLRACYDEAIAPQPAAVSEAEVEAAARALCHSDGWHWETRSPERRKSYQRTARAALTAARAAKGEGEGT